MDITIGMPVKAYLKNYVYWKENLQPEQIIDLSGPGDITFVLAGLLTGKLKAGPHGDPDDLPGIYDAELITRVTVTQYNRNLFFYSLDNIRYFNTYLYRNFHETLLHEICANRRHGITEVDTIWQFIDRLKAHDLISFDAIKKASYRLRKAKNLPIFRCANSIWG